MDAETRIKNALAVALDFGQQDEFIDHKNWTIDQIIRALVKNDDEYHSLIADYNKDRSEFFRWDCGIAP